jgi:hypothetical protein
MKKLLFVTIALLMMAPFAMAQHQGGTISGTVGMRMDTIPAPPIPFAHVFAYVPNGQMPVAMAATDSLGHYTLHVQRGNYQVKAEAMRFDPLWYNNVTERSQATTVAVTDSVNPTGIDFLLNPEGPPPPPPGQGTISGTVAAHSDSANVPFGGVHISAYHPNGDHPVAFATTDNQGHYTLHVEFGDYQIKAEAMHFVSLWYNNVTERSQATTVAVADSVNPTGIDFLLNPVPPPPPPPGQGTISGNITAQMDTLTVPLAAMVYAYHPNSDHPSAYTMTDRSGNYTLHVEFGDYQIRAEAMRFVSEWYNNVTERAQATIVTVADSVNPTGIDFVLAPQGPPPPPPPPLSGISGTVTNFATNLPLTGAMVTAISVNNHWMHFMARTDSTGAYLIGARPGEYVVQASARGFTMMEYPTHVTVPESTIVANINFALTPINFGSISGMVTDTAGVGLAGAFVEARKLGMPYNLHTRTDSTGAYTFSQVIAGSYRLRAFKRGFMHGMYPDSVVVAEGQAVTGINIVLGQVPPPFRGSIAGTVTADSTGAPIAHAVVVAIGGDRHRMFRYTFTDDDGTYTLDGLSDVPYKVFCASRGFVGEFYNNVTNINDATPVTPNATGINFALATSNPGPRAFGGYVSTPEGICAGSVVYASVDGQIVSITVSDLDGYYSFEGIEPGTFAVAVASVDGDGQLDQPVDASFSDVGDANIVIEPLSTGDVAPIPTASSLAQNYPNPFNAQTMIAFNLSTSGRVQLDVYNMIGQKITTLVDGDFNSGSYNVIWNGRDASGNAVSSGIYYYRLKTNSQVETMKMTLLK